MGKFIAEMSLNSDIWMGDQFDTREEAIEEGMKLAKEEELKQFRIGETAEVPIPGVDAELVLERISEMVYEEVGECAEDYLDDVEDSHLSELEDSFNEVFFKWLEKYKYDNSYYRIKNEEIILCEEERERLKIINYIHPKQYKGLKINTERWQIRARARVEKYCFKCDKFMGQEHDFSECRLVDYWRSGERVMPKTCPFDSVAIEEDIITVQENLIKCKVEE